MAEHVTEVREGRGGWIQVTGVADGKRVSAEIPKHYVDGQSREQATKTFERVLKNARTVEKE